MMNKIKYFLLTVIISFISCDSKGTENNNKNEGMKNINKINIFKEIEEFYKQYEGIPFVELMRESEIEAPETVYKYIKMNIDSKELCSDYYNTIILIDFELNESRKTILTEERTFKIIDEKGNWGYVNDANRLATLLNDIDITQFNFLGEDDYGDYGYSFLVEGNKLCEM